MLRRAVLAVVSSWILFTTVAVVPALAACPEWTVVPSRNPQPKFNTLTDVSALSGTDAWAVGATGQGKTTRPLIEHWNGAVWSVVPGPPVKGAFLGLTAVVALSPTNVWAVGNKGSTSRPLIIHWNGVKWSVAAAGTPGRGFVNVGLEGIAAFAPDDIWAVGTSTRSAQVWRPLVEHWDGGHWRVVNAPNPVTTVNTLVGVSAVSATNVWAVGWYGLAKQSPLIEHWNGTRWSRVAAAPVAAGGTLLGVEALSATDIWAAGQTEQAVPHGLIQHGNGSTWTRPTGGAAAASGVGFYGTDGVWSVGGRATSQGTSRAAAALRSGSVWSEVTPISPGGSAVLNAVTEIPISSDAWAVGSTVKGGATRTLIERGCHT